MTDTRRPVPSQQMRPRLPPARSSPERWVGLREAEELTGIPASTIRNWARKQRIESRFELDESGDRRYVEISEVVAWADHLGRHHKNVARSRTKEAPKESEVDAGVAATRAEDVPKSKLVATESPAATTDAASNDDGEPVVVRGAEVEPHQEQPAIPEGTMLVPLDAWNKMLQQLGNLHQAGQQLAEARERAAKAETESTFLRERLVEMRDQIKDLESQPPSTAVRAGTGGGEPAAPQPDASSIDQPIEPLWVDLYHRWARRRARRR